MIARLGPDLLQRLDAGVVLLAVVEDDAPPRPDRRPARRMPAPRPRGVRRAVHLGGILEIAAALVQPARLGEVSRSGRRGRPPGMHLPFLLEQARGPIEMSPAAFHSSAARKRLPAVSRTSAAFAMTRPGGPGSPPGWPATGRRGPCPASCSMAYASSGFCRRSRMSTAFSISPASRQARAACSSIRAASKWGAARCGSPPFCSSSPQYRW